MRKHRTQENEQAERTGLILLVVLIDEKYASQLGLVLATLFCGDCAEIHAQNRLELD